MIIDGIKGKELQKKKDSFSCIFFDEQNIRCTIYENRPFDCEMYPFDIMWYENDYYWIVYSCNLDSNWEWCEEHLQKLEADSRFEEIMKNPEIYFHTSYGHIHKLMEPPWTVLRKVKKLN